MKRKMIGAAAAYMSGLFFASFFLTAAGAAAVAGAAAILLIFGLRRNFRPVDYIIIIVSFWTAFAANRLYTVKCCDRLTALAGTAGSFSGTVEDYDVYDGGTAVYILKGRINGTQRAKIIFQTDELDADLGDILEIENCNFDELQKDYLFDSKTWNKGRHIFIQASTDGDIAVVKTDRALFRRMLSRFRRKMISRLRVEMGIDAGSFLAGMIFGEKKYIDHSTRTALYRSGIGHVLAVSGLHVSIIASLAVRLLKRLRIGKFWRFAAINLLFITLITMTEYPVSAIRAALMLDVMYSAELFAQQNDSFNSLAIASLLICICDPYAVYSSGFILSVSGTFGIAVFSPYIAKSIDKSKPVGKLLTVLVTGVFTAVSVMPASMFYFEESSLIAPAANVLLVPICTASMIFGLIFVVTGGVFTFILAPAKLMLLFVIKLSDMAANVGLFHIPKTSTLLPVIFAVSAAAVVIVYLYSDRRMVLSIALAAAIVFDSAAALTIRQVNDSRLKIAVLGRNSNAAAVVTYSGTAIIADLSGHHRTNEYVRKYLTENGIENVRILILSNRYEAAYSAYLNNLDYFKLQDTVYVTADSRFTMEIGELAIDAAENMLEISGDGWSFNASAEKGKFSVNKDISINFSSQTTDRSIHTNEMNNFEILPSDDGKCSIRRL